MWFDTFAAALQESGLAGKVKAATEARLPAWLRGESTLPRQLTAFASYRTVDLGPVKAQERSSRWNVDPAVTADVLDAAADWAAFDTADVYLLANLFRVRVEAPSVATGLTARLDAYGAGVRDVRKIPAAPGDEIEFEPAGRACYQAVDVQRSWSERLGDLVTILTSTASHLDLAFIQRNSLGVTH